MSLPMTCRSAGHQLRERVRVVGEARAGDVVDERVVPDVDHARLGIPRPVLALRGLAVLGDRERDAPRGAGAADREVLEPLADEAEHLVAAVLGLHEVGVLLEVALEPLLVGRQAEEPVALGQPLERHVGVVGAAAAVRRLEQVRRRLEALVRAVPALVRAEVDVAVRVRPADHLLGRPVVVGVGGPDEPVGADAAARPRPPGTARPSRRRSRAASVPSASARLRDVDASARRCR